MSREVVWNLKEFAPILFRVRVLLHDFKSPFNDDSVERESFARISSFRSLSHFRFIHMSLIHLETVIESMISSF